jgi:hypothetical protein
MFNDRAIILGLAADAAKPEPLGADRSIIWIRSIKLQEFVKVTEKWPIGNFVR